MRSKLCYSSWSVLKLTALIAIFVALIVSAMSMTRKKSIQYDDPPGHQRTIKMLEPIIEPLPGERSRDIASVEAAVLSSDATGDAVIDDPTGDLINDEPCEEANDHKPKLDHIESDLEKMDRDLKTIRQQTHILFTRSQRMRQRQRGAQ